MKSLKPLPRSLHYLRQSLPMQIRASDISPAPLMVNAAHLHRALGIEDRAGDWLLRGIAAWSDMVAGGWHEPVFPLLAWCNDHRELVVHIEFALHAAYNAYPADKDQVLQFIHHEERRHRIKTGGSLSALEVATEYDLLDRRQNCTLRIGNSIAKFAAAHPNMAQPGIIGPKNERVRGFPAATVQIWYRRGGGSALIEAERSRPKKQRAPRPVRAPDYEDEGVPVPF